MKMRILNVEIKSTREALEEFKSVYKRVARGEKVRPTEGIYFPDLDTARRILTPERLQVIRCIRDRNPRSIYQLAKILGRDFKNVHTEVQDLRGMGIVKIERSRRGRRQVIPRVPYDRINLGIAL